MSNPANTGLRGVVAVLAIFASSVVMSAEAEGEYEWRAGGTYSDNFELLPSNQERSAIAAVVGLKLDGRRPEGRLRYDLMADVSQYEYLNRDVNGELMGRANLHGSYAFVPEAFSWDAGLTYDQARHDPARPLAPGNSDSQTTFSTGPSLRLRFSGAMEAQISGRYSQQNTSSTPIDNDTLGGRLVIQRSTTPRSALGVGYSYDEVSYRGAPGASASDFDRQEIFARMNLAGARTEVNLEAGYADISGPLVSDGGLMLRTRLSRRFAPTLSAFVGYVREYPTSDVTALFGTGPTSGTSGIGNAPRIAASGEAGLQMQRPRTSAALTYYYREESALLVGGSKRKLDELHADMTRSFTPRSRGTLFYHISQEDFSQFASGIDTHSFGAGLELDVGRALSVGFRLQHSQRDSTASTGGYSETNGAILLSYRGALGRPASASGSR
jgi:hypothetical protein